MHVFVIDDEGDQLWLVREYLEQARFKVTTANTGKTVLEEIRKTKFDLIILDISIPDTDTFALFCEIKEKYPTIPILIYTGLDNGLGEQPKLDKWKQQSDAFLVKSFNLNDLVEQVKLLFSAKC
jgi:DNA-binding response OmpR family regulator